MALHEVQELLGHRSLSTTTVYSTPHMDDVIEHYRTKITERASAADGSSPAGQRYNPDELSVLWGNQ